MNTFCVTLLPPERKEKERKEEKKEENAPTVFLVLGARGPRNEAILDSRGLATLESYRESSAARSLSSA